MECLVHFARTSHAPTEAWFSMHFDYGSLRRLSCLAMLLAAVLAFLAITTAQGLLIPPEVAQEDFDALQRYSELIEALHEQSGGFHQRFKALRLQLEGGDQQTPLFAEDGDLAEEGKKKGDKKQPKHGDDDGEAKLVSVVLGVMSKCVLYLTMTGSRSAIS